MLVTSDVLQGLRVGNEASLPRLSSKEPFGPDASAGVPIDSIAALTPAPILRWAWSDQLFRPCSSASGWRFGTLQQAHAAPAQGCGVNLAAREIKSAINSLPPAPYRAWDHDPGTFEGN
jgi:hypothetical protein